MNIQELYASKLVSAGDRCCCRKVRRLGRLRLVRRALPSLSTRRLAARMPELSDVKIPRRHHAPPVPPSLSVPDAAEHICWNSWHMSGIERKAIDKGFGSVQPASLR